MKSNITTMQTEKLSKETFAQNQNVRIISGSFSSMDGFVKSFNDEISKLIVIIPIFGHNTEVELDYNQVTIINE